MHYASRKLCNQRTQQQSPDLSTLQANEASAEMGVPGRQDRGWRKQRKLLEKRNPRRATSDVGGVIYIIYFQRK